MTETMLSLWAKRVLVELAEGSKAVSDWTSLARIQKVLGCDLATAHVVVQELDAAGHVRNLGDGKRIRIRATPDAADTTRFTRAIQAVATEVVRIGQQLGDPRMPWRQGSLISRIAPELTPAASDWVAAHGSRAQAMLLIAWERGWYSLVSSFALPLGTLWHAARDYDNAHQALETGLAAENRMHRTRMAELHLCHAGVSADLHQHDEAERAATAAVVCALEVATDEDVLTRAYSLRGEIRERGGNAARAMEDYEQASMVALTVPRHASGSGRLAARDDREIARARYLAAMSRAEEAAARYAQLGGHQEHAILLTAINDAVRDVAQADPARQRFRRFLRTWTELLPSAATADIAMTIASRAEADGRDELVRECYELALAHYAASGQVEPAGIVRARLADLARRVSEPDHARPD